MIQLQRLSIPFGLRVLPQLVGLHPIVVLQSGQKYRFVLFLGIFSELQDYRLLDLSLISEPQTYRLMDLSLISELWTNCLAFALDFNVRRLPRVVLVNFPWNQEENSSSPLPKVFFCCNLHYHSLATSVSSVDGAL